MKFEIFKDPMSDEYIICVPELDNSCIKGNSVKDVCEEFVTELEETIEYILSTTRFDDCHIYCPNCGTEISPEVASTIIACPYCGCEWKR